MPKAIRHYVRLVDRTNEAVGLVAMYSVFLIVGMTLMGLTFGPMSAVLPELFPTNVRYTGSGVAYNAASILVNPFGREERYVNTRDLMTLHEGQWVSFAPRVSDLVQVPGSTLSAADIEERCAEVVGVRDACAYPVDDLSGGADGTPRAVMVALVVEPSFSLVAFAEHTQAQLPEAAWPRYLRLTASIATTSSRRPIKGRLYAEGADPRHAPGAVFALDVARRYVPWEPAHAASPEAPASEEAEASGE